MRDGKPIIMAVTPNTPPNSNSPLLSTLGSVLSCLCAILLSVLGRFVKVLLEGSGSSPFECPLPLSAASSGMVSLEKPFGVDLRDVRGLLPGVGTNPAGNVGFLFLCIRRVLSRLGVSSYLGVFPVLLRVSTIEAAFQSMRR